MFKYIQILIKSSSSNETKYVVRGYVKYEYHAKNYTDFQSIHKIILKLLKENSKVSEFQIMFRRDARVGEN